MAAEPDITKWDIQTGDGDCGEAVVGMCNAVTQHLDTPLFESGDLFPILDAIGDGIEEIGGTLGAIIAIIVASFTSALKTSYAKSPDSFQANTEETSKAAGEALRNLMTYTGARVGGRTVMDTLIPFCEEFEKSRDLYSAVKQAVAGAEKTEGMGAKFGRATYLAEDKMDSATPMDPGAWAAAVFLRGLGEGFAS